MSSDTRHRPQLSFIADFRAVAFGFKVLGIYGAGPEEIDPGSISLVINPSYQGSSGACVALASIAVSHPLPAAPAVSTARAPRRLTLERAEGIRLLRKRISRVPYVGIGLTWIKYSSTRAATIGMGRVVTARA